MFLGSLEEARAKANKALILSDLSANDENLGKKEKLFENNKQMESPPTLKCSKMYCLCFICSAFHDYINVY